MNVWKVTISGEELGYFDEYHGKAEKGKEAGEKALEIAKEQSKEDKNFNDELYVSEISFIAYLEF